MLSWENDFVSAQDPPSSEFGFGSVADLIDHTQGSTIGDKPTTSRTRLAWDGRKGQWIPMVYSYAFPANPFDHLDGRGKLKARQLASFSFEPSKRHAVMLDQGSPKLRIRAKTVIQGRYPKFISKTMELERLSLTNNGSSMIIRESYETDDEDNSVIGQGWERYDPFNLDNVKPVQPMPWLDDINIEDFLSSAIDYKVDFSLPVNDSMSGGKSIEITLDHNSRSKSPCTPSSPPPPLFFTDDHRPIPDFRLSPSNFTTTTVEN